MKNTETIAGSRHFDSAAVDRLIDGMRRRSWLRLVLLSLFLFNAIAVGVFTLYLSWKTTPSPGFLLPAFATECLSLALLGFLWRGSLRRRRLARDSTRPASEFLGTLLTETRAALRERRILMLGVTFVLTPLFLLATADMAGGEKMSIRDALFAAILYAISLAVILGLAWRRTQQLRSRVLEFHRMLSDLTR